MRRRKRKNKQVGVAVTKKIQKIEVKTHKVETKKLFFGRENTNGPPNRHFISSLISHASKCEQEDLVLNIRSGNAYLHRLCWMKCSERGYRAYLFLLLMSDAGFWFQTHLCSAIVLMTAEVTLAVSDSEVSLSSTAAQNVLQVSS
jgi:hypothetical protein